MLIEAKETEYCKLQVHYEADADQIESKKMEVLTAFKDAPVKGFTKKAPLDAIRLYYAREIDNALKQALSEEGFHQTLGDQNVKPFSMPQFSNVQLTKNKFMCDMEFNIRPKFTVAQYKEMQIPKQPLDFNIEEEVAKSLENLRKRFGESEPFKDDEFVQTTDILIIDYDCFDGDTKLDAASGQGQIINVGQSMLPGFDDNLLGMKSGDTREFFIKAPETSLPSFAGKELKFVVSLTMGSKVIPVPLTDELAKKVGLATLDEVREQIVGMAQAKQQDLERTKNSQQILNKLLVDNDIKIPIWLTSSEAKMLASNSGLEWETIPEMDKEQYLRAAEKNVKVALILDEIRDNEPDAQLSDQEVLSAIDERLKKMYNSQEDVEKMMRNMGQNGELQIMAARMKDEHCIDFLIKNAKIVE